MRPLTLLRSSLLHPLLKPHPSSHPSWRRLHGSRPPLDSRGRLHTRRLLPRPRLKPPDVQVRRLDSLPGVRRETTRRGGLKEVGLSVRLCPSIFITTSLLCGSLTVVVDCVCRCVGGSRTSRRWSACGLTAHCTTKNERCRSALSTRVHPARHGGPCNPNRLCAQAYTDSCFFFDAPAARTLLVAPSAAPCGRLSLRSRACAWVQRSRARAFSQRGQVL